MSYMDHIKTCNRVDLSAFVRFLSATNVQIGWVKKTNIVHLKKYGDVFDLSDSHVALKVKNDITSVMDVVCRDLAKRGVLTGWRDEPFKVAPNFQAKALFAIERVATSFFGIRAFGVHLNGFVRDPDGLKMWVGRRAMDRGICPGMLDNMVAGGQPANLSLMDNVIKECAEEADVPKQLAQTAQPVGVVSYQMETDNGLKPDVMYCYDLELPQDFIPFNADGETAEFHLWPIEQVADVVRNSFEFKFNCNLVVIDFLIRHGVITPENEPDYEALVKGLRA